MSTQPSHKVCCTPQQRPPLRCRRLAALTEQAGLLEQRMRMIPSGLMSGVI